MRMSKWSSGVCSSNLQALHGIRPVLLPDGLLFVHPGLYYSNFGHHLGEFSTEPHFHLKKSPQALRELVFSTTPNYIDRSGEFASPAQYRSEEHTSELQSLMRNSYAVFCLKKKKNKNINTIHHNENT